MSGFIPFSRASLSLDLVAVAMLAVVPILLWSIYLVAVRKNYRWHKRIQLSLGGLLAAAITLFEVEMRLYGWRQYAEASPYYDTLLNPVLYVHLFFAISTTLLWMYTIVGAMLRFDRPVRPGAYSAHHKRIARLAAVDMVMTAITGWVFYYIAFIATV